MQSGAGCTCGGMVTNQTKIIPSNSFLGSTRGQKEVDECIWERPYPSITSGSYRATSISISSSRTKSQRDGVWTSETWTELERHKFMSRIQEWRKNVTSIFPSDEHQMKRLCSSPIHFVRARIKRAAASKNSNLLSFTVCLVWHKQKIRAPEEVPSEDRASWSSTIAWEFLKGGAIRALQ